MKRAAELFAIDEWGSDSRFVEKAWTSRSEPEPEFISVAVSRAVVFVQDTCLPGSRTRAKGSEADRADNESRQPGTTRHSVAVAENYFDERIAATYEAKWPELFESAVVDPAVSFLARLARSGTALELGIGTGRLALPLARRGIRVHGIELSPPMAARLRAQPGADAVGVTIGDFATAAVDRTFGLAYLVRNTIMNLTTQDAQVQCFRNAAAHLEPGGCFVIEVIVPDLQRLPPGETVRAFTVNPRHLGFDEYDIAAQGIISHHYWMTDGQAETFSAPFRYAWPSELDLMARLAGMTLRERWSSWRREPFTSHSRSHISVWQTPA
jgi:SAM-dependent methyltransferase